MGNQIVLMKNLNEQQERAFFECCEANTAEAYTFHYDMHSVAEKGALTMFGNSYYYALRDKNKKVAMVRFNYELSSYEFLSPEKKQLAAALGIEQTILLMDTDTFALKARVTT